MERKDLLISELLEALENVVARMDENMPKPAKKGDLDATFKRATFFRDREAARNVIAKVKGG